jgi:SSS family solute:Na+ symporter
MSSLASLFNSSASLFTMDVYGKLRPGRSEKHLLGVGRIATVVVVTLGMLWIPVMEKVQGGGLYQYLQNVQGYVAPPIAAVFLLGMFWKRVNSTGAVWGLSIGFVLGMIKLTIQTFFGAAEGRIHDPAILAAIGDFNPYYSTGVLALISAVIIAVGSLMTPAPAEEQIRGLTYGSIHAEGAAEIKASWDTGNKVMAVTILALVAALYLYFSFWLS